MAQEFFRYTPIQRDSRTIRVASLLPAPYFNCDIKLELYEISLDSLPKYKALSYVWGSPLYKAPISINGGLLSVTLNCELALRYLRGRYEDITLWIDAICIDQTNLAERSHQVSLMGGIYKCAEEVVVWIGNDQSEASISWSKSEYLSATFLNRLAEHYLAQTEDSDSGLDFNLFHNTFMCDANWEANCVSLKRLFLHPWWKRLWVHQEVILAKRAKVQLGNESFSWDTLTTAIKLIDGIETCVKEGEYWRSSHAMEKWTMMRSCKYINASHRINIREGFHLLDPLEQQLTTKMQSVEPDVLEKGVMRLPLSGFEIPLPQAMATLLPVLNLKKHLGTMRAFRCSDPRDFIFSVRGLVDGSERFITPDYSKSVSQVYLDFAVAIASHTLDTLSNAGFKTMALPLGLPSWVVAWGFDDEAKRPRQGLIGRYHATLDYPPFVGFEENFRVLIASGVRIDEVKEFLPISSEDLVIGMKDPVHIETLLETHFPLIEAHDRERLFVRTITGDNGYDNKRLSMKTLEKWVEFLHPFMRHFARTIVAAGRDFGGRRLSEESMYRWLIDKSSIPEAIQTEEDLKALGDLFREKHSEILDVHRLEAMKFRKVSEDTGKGMAMIRTSLGRMALVPLPTKQGDIIIALVGCHVPLILRSFRGRYMLVGECFIYGFMDGEALRGKDIRKDLERFAIC